MVADTLLYLYGVAPAAAPDAPDDLRGLEQHPVEVVREAALAGIVSHLPAATYGQAPLEARIAQIEWLGQRAVEHERVLQWFMQAGGILPIAPFSLHSSEALLRTALRAWVGRADAALRRLEGHREWGVKIWRNEERLSAHIEARSAALRQLARERAEAAPGRRYLLDRRRADILPGELASLVSTTVSEAFASLRGEAAEARALDVPAQAGPRTVALHAVFLVAGNAEESFMAAARQRAEQQHELGLDWELGGPWPPYHFAAF